MCIGDFNARTGAEPDYIPLDRLDNQVLRNVGELFDYVSDECSTPRVSQDKTVNNFGRNLLRLCKSTGIRIVNGRSPGDNIGRFTFYHRNGSSCIDYAICSKDILHIVSDFTVCDFNMFSDHAPCLIDVVCSLKKINKVVVNKGNPLYMTLTVWNEECKVDILNSLSGKSEQLQILFKNICPTKESIDKSVTDLTHLIYESTNQYCSHTVKCKNVGGHCLKSVRDKPWFDDNCRELYRSYKEALYVFNKHSSFENRYNLAEKKENI